MTDLALPIATRAERDLRLGLIFDRTTSVLRRNFLPFFAVTTVANLPGALLSDGPALTTHGLEGIVISLAGALLPFVLGMFGQAIVVHGTFQDMRGRPVSLVEPVMVAMRRFVPLIGLSLGVIALTLLGFMLLVIPGLIVLTMLSVATPVCVVEQLGPFRSMERSAQLTKGHRWTVFGAMAVLQIVTAVVGSVIEQIMPAVAGSTLVMAGDVIWNGITSAVLAVFAFVLYHDLRVIRDGVDTDQIASVFE